ncbi:MAG TPA: anhydro-N-acetylmuramic acid kinase [Rhodothermales bacterium]|nr:anhydro-N-acetylmuramic acid kinase [Rhodothermales bacterium]
MSRLNALLTKHARTVAGIMSGTSVDGVDVAIVRLDGSGPGLGMEILGDTHLDYAAGFRDLVLSHALDRGATVKSISQLNVALSHVYADAVRSTLDRTGLKTSDLDLIGCHGQTVQHVPVPEDVAGRKVTSTLQLGDPAVLANLLGVPVVGNFRQPDMALGGQGAPLVPYFDYVAFSDPVSYRVLLNLGGIANLTFLPPDGRPEDVIAFDTGPANMLIDFLCLRLFNVPMDRNGEIGASSRPDTGLMTKVLAHEYFERRPPKATGRELFNDAFASDVCHRFEGTYGPEPGWTDAQRRTVISSVTWLSARSIADAMRRWNPLDRRPDVVIAAGGGTLNPTLMSMLRQELDGVDVKPIDDFGIRTDVKEALCFAVLAHEFVNEVPTGMPSVTGARSRALQGSLSLPSDPADS